MFLLSILYSERKMYRPINSIDELNQYKMVYSKWSFNQPFYTSKAPYNIDKQFLITNFIYCTDMSKSSNVDALLSSDLPLNAHIYAI